MQVLIVEDNNFNAFCLRRLIELTDTTAHIQVATSSKEALDYVKNNPIDLAILDGHLAPTDALNGPSLAALLWQQQPSVSIVSWTNCPEMRKKFAEVFESNNRLFNHFSHMEKRIDPTNLKDALLHFQFPCLTQKETRCA